MICSFLRFMAYSRKLISAPITENATAVTNAIVYSPVAWRIAETSVGPKKLDSPNAQNVTV